MKSAPVTTALLLLGLACLAGLVRAAGGQGTATATVVTPMSVQTSPVQELLNRFSFPVVLPAADSGGRVRIPQGSSAPSSSPGDPPASGGATAGSGGSATAPADGSGGVQAVRDANGSVSINVTGGAGLAYAMTRTPEGGLNIDFN